MTPKIKVKYMKGINMIRNKKLHPSAFNANPEIVNKYNLDESWGNFSKVLPPKRGANKESLSDAKNAWVRAMLDKITPNSYSMTEAYRIGVTLFQGECYVCEKKLYNADGSKIIRENVQADHVISSTHGGIGTAGNLLAICINCNNAKSDSHFEDFLKNKPETISKIKDFQKLFNYSPIECNELVNAKSRISIAFEIAKMLVSSKLTLKTLEEIHEEISKMQ
jgi:hypothetical protein